LLDELDKKAENSLFDELELNLKHVLNERLDELLREEELKWYQRAKVKHLLEGDTNKKYYHQWETSKNQNFSVRGWGKYCRR